MFISNEELIAIKLLLLDVKEILEESQGLGVDDEGLEKTNAVLETIEKYIEG